ncbi:MAG: hypothetical protein ABI647_23100 [Gemmatimonadota bacterium]
MGQPTDSSPREDPGVYGATAIAGQLAVIALAACGRGDQSQPDGTRADERFAAVERAVFATDSASRIDAIALEAAAVGPRRSFRARVISARDGRLRFEQSFAGGETYVAAIGPSGAWEWDGRSPTVTPLSAAELSAVRGHDFLMLAVLPRTRLVFERLQDSVAFDLAPSWAAKCRDVLGAPLRIYYDGVTNLPLGYEVRNHNGTGAADVRAVFGPWTRQNDHMVPRSVTLHQGTDRYEFTFTRIEPVTFSDSLVIPPRPFRR